MAPDNSGQDDSPSNNDSGSSITLSELAEPVGEAKRFYEWLNQTLKAVNNTMRANAWSSGYYDRTNTIKSSTSLYHYEVFGSFSEDNRDLQVNSVAGPYKIFVDVTSTALWTGISKFGAAAIYDPVNLDTYNHVQVTVKPVSKDGNLINHNVKQFDLHVRDIKQTESWFGICPNPDTPGLRDVLNYGTISFGVTISIKDGNYIKPEPDVNNTSVEGETNNVNEAQPIDGAPNDRGDPEMHVIDTQDWSVITRNDFVKVTGDQINGRRYSIELNRTYGGKELLNMGLGDLIISPKRIDPNKLYFISDVNTELDTAKRTRVRIVWEEL